MKAQISTEYLIIVGFALLLTIPTVLLFFSQSARNVDQVNSAQARQIARKIVDNAEKVYYLGEPSSTTVKVVMPRNVDSVVVSRRAVILRLSGSAGESDIVELSAVNLTGSVSSVSGVRYLRIENIGDRVNISG